MVARGQARWKPEKPITIYNPFAAGGVTDVHIRMLGETVSKVLGQQVIVDVKAGAAGTLAPAMLLNAKPDGQTLACMSINSLRYPHYQKTNWDPLKDFTYISGLSGYTMGIVVKSTAPWQTLEELIAAGKKEPEKYNFGTSGIGGTGQLMMIEVEQATGAQVHPRSLQGRCGMDAGAAQRPGAFPGRRRAMGAVRRQRPVPHPRAGDRAAHRQVQGRRRP